MGILFLSLVFISGVSAPRIDSQIPIKALSLNPFVFEKGNFLAGLAVESLDGSSANGVQNSASNANGIFKSADGEVEYQIIERDGEKYIIRDGEESKLLTASYDFFPSSICKDEQINIPISGNLDLLTNCWGDWWVDICITIWEDDTVGDDKVAEYCGSYYTSGDITGIPFSHTFNNIDLSDWIVSPEPGGNGEFYVKVTGQCVKPEGGFSSVTEDVYGYVNGECKCLSGACCNLASRPYNYKSSGSQPTGYTDYYFCSGSNVKFRDYFCNGYDTSLYSTDSTSDTCGTCEYCQEGQSSCKYSSSSTVCGTQDCDYLDTTCRNYNDVNRYCSGSSATCNSGTCNSYSNEPSSTSCGTCKNCDGGGSCSNTPSDSSGCGTIDCSSWYVQTGTESPTATEYCYNKIDITSNRCEGFGDCKDPNTADCNSQSNDILKYSCGVCKYISSSSCTGTTLGSCTNYVQGTSCGTNKECDGQGSCVVTQCSETDISCGVYPTCVNCNSNDGCYGDYYRNYYCVSNVAGCSYTSDNCNDCSCSCGGYNVAETTANGNCNDGKDNDCDGLTDSNDPYCCVDECSSGQKRCSGSYKQTCGNYDADVCLEWPSSTSGPGNEYCGDDSCGSWGDNYCKEDDVYHSRTCYDKGCASGSCFDNPFPDEQKAQECGLAGCSNDACNIACSLDSDCGTPSWKNTLLCQSDDVYDYWITPKCAEAGTENAYCYNQENLQLKQDCGIDSYSANYCYDNDVYRDFYDRGCSNGACFELTPAKQKVAECGSAGCSNGNCLSGVWLIAPEDNRQFSRTITENFNWGASSEYTSFKIEFSRYSDFSTKKNLGGTVKNNYNYKGNEKDWSNLRKEANIDSDGVLYYRVYGQGTSKKYSNVYKFSLEPPTAPTLLSPNEGKNLVVGDSFSFDYGSYTQAEIKISTSTSFYTYLRLAKLKKTSGNSYYVDSSIYNKIKSFANKYGVSKLYWRVEVKDNEKLTGFSATRSFNI